MATPSVTPVTPASATVPAVAADPSAGARRRQRSTRLVVAVALLLLAAALVTAAALTGSWLPVTVAAALAVVLGAAAVRITHAELQVSRRTAAGDRADQARGYLRLTQARIAEHAGFVAYAESSIATREQALRELESALTAAQSRAAEAVRGRSEQERRAVLAERERDTVAGHLNRSEAQAAEAVVRVAELEGEIDVLRAELESVTAAWRAYQVRHPA